MANITINTSGNSVIVDFGDYASLENIDGRKASYKIEDISVVWLEKDDSTVNVIMKASITTNYWILSYVSTGGAFIVDSINGVAPVSNPDLFDMITALRG